jgi:hypothetical protein
MSSRKSTKKKNVDDQYETGATTKRSKTPVNSSENTTIYSIPLPAGGGTTATNIIGTSLPSAASNAVVPANTPTTVEYLVVAGGGGGAEDDKFADDWRAVEDAKQNVDTTVSKENIQSWAS